MGVLRKIIRRTANKLGYDVCRSYRFWINPPNLLDLAIRSIQREDFFLIQIGANNGVSYDPVRPYILEFKWKGILVEPQSRMFQTLLENYKGHNQLIFENCAITNVDGPISMYRQKEWIKGRPEPEALATVRQGKLEGELEKETVAGMTLFSLLQKHNVRRVDYLQVDAEWFDDQIVRQALGLPENLKPRIMHFEADWLPAKEAIALYTELTRQGYRIDHGRGGFPENDTVAVRDVISSVGETKLAAESK
jgi:FkbM family methyltransferase